ncbi:MAG: S41 family peptidase, partial [Chloroflexota bacterium]
AFDGLLRLFISQHTTYTLSDGRQVLVNHDEAKGTQTLADLHTTGRWIDENDIALIHIPSFNEERFQDVALDYVEQFKDAHTIIFDMRDCTGGNTPSKLIRALMDRPYQMWTEATPANFALFHYRYQEREWGHSYTQDAEYKAYYDGMVSHFRRPMLMWSPSVTLPENPIYTGRILMLIGIEIGSAGEDFVIPFKSSGRATLIGENTLGSTGQPYHYRLIDDIWLAVGAKRAYMPDGSSYEGIGIAPDIHLQATVADLRAGRDVVLEHALEMARSVATD